MSAVMATRPSVSAIPESSHGPGPGARVCGAREEADRGPPTGREMRRLQRAAGNRATAALVGSHLARQPVGTGAGSAAEAEQATRDRQYWVAFAMGDWPAMAYVLNRFDDAEMDARIARLISVEQLTEVADAARAAGPQLARVLAHVEPARVRRLGEEWRAAYTRGDWERAVELVNAYSDTDLPVKLEPLTYDQLMALLGQADKMVFYVRVRLLAEPIRIRKLGIEYGAAVNGGNWARAVLLADAYSDVDLLPRLRQIQAKGPAALQTALFAARMMVFDGDRVARRLTFLQMEGQVGPTARPPSPAGGINLGAPAPISVGGFPPAVAMHGTVPGGSVSAYTNVSAGGTGNWYGLQYQGADAQDTGWIQFISREIERFDDPSGGRSLGFYVPSGTILHLGQPEAIRYGTATKPVWYTDTFSNTLPFYESPVTGPAPPAWAQPVGTRGGNISQPSQPAVAGPHGHPPVPGQTTMIDNPGMVAAHVDEAFGPTGWEILGIRVKRVEVRARFHQYLVRGMDVLYQNGVLVQEVYTTAPKAGGKGARTNIELGGGAASKMAPEHYQALIRRFPQYTFYAH
jgi:hypothetical protein